VRLALITNLVATIVVAVTTGSAEAVMAVQVPTGRLLGGHALTR
jgi:mRNA-degrading endonuclease toxin of MazEF toxin-antitoxin module